MESRDTGKSSKIYIPKCIRDNCHGFPLVKNCWCCFNDADICWHDREICMRLCWTLRRSLNFAFHYTQSITIMSSVFYFYLLSNPWFNKKLIIFIWIYDNNLEDLYFGQCIFHCIKGSFFQIYLSVYTNKVEFYLFSAFHIINIIGVFANTSAYFWAKTQLSYTPTLRLLVDNGLYKIGLKPTNQIHHLLPFVALRLPNTIILAKPLPLRLYASFMRFTHCS